MMFDYSLICRGAQSAFPKESGCIETKTPLRQKGSNIRKAFDEAFLGKPATDLRGPNAYVFIIEMSFLFVARCNDSPHVSR